MLDVIPGLPSGQAELDDCFSRHGVTDEGRAFVLEALAGPPARRVGGGGGNVVVRVASRKMQRVIQAESRTVEFAFIQQCEHDPAVRFFLCQPGKLLARGRNALGVEKGYWCTPDYLVLDDSGFALVECKPLAELQRRSVGENPRFVKDGEGWRWPAAEEAAREFGFQFRVFSSDRVNQFWHRNMTFLADYMEAANPDPRLAQAVVKELSEAGSMRVREALALVEGKSETLWWLVANGKVEADVNRELVFEADTSTLYSSKARMAASRHAKEPMPDVVFSQEVSVVSVEPGCRLLWNGVPYTILNRARADVTLRADGEGGKSVVVPIDDFYGFMRSGAIQGDKSELADSIFRRRETLLSHASDESLAVALRRYRFLEAFRETGAVPPGLSMRSIRRYAMWAQEGERLFGSEYLGLLRFRGRRPGTPGLGERQQAIVEAVVKQFEDDLKAGRVAAAYARLVDLCDEQDIRPVPSKGTLRLAAKRLSVSDSARKREGAREAYRKSGPVVKVDGAIPSTPDRVFQVAHVDHTQLDIYLVLPRTKTVLGRPWLTVMEDGFSHMPLAALISYDSPSRVSLCNVLLDCVSRHNRVPDNLVVDQGNEFNSIYFEAALGALEITKVERPAAKARFGSIIERYFGTTNMEFIHELAGNTKLSQRGRRLSSTHDPKRLAVWTLAEFHEFLMRWLFQTYPDLRHQRLGTTPREVFECDLAYSGDRAVRYVPLDDNLRMMLALPPQHGSTRRVSGNRGITISYLNYWHEDFGYGDVRGIDVEVKIDPANCGVAYAWVRGRWVTCRLVDGDADLSGRSWKQIHLAIDELSQRRRAGAKAVLLNARILGRFLRDANAHEEHLARQIQRDEEARSISCPDSGAEVLSKPKPEPEKGARPAPSPEAVSPDGTIRSTMPWLVFSDNDTEMEDDEYDVSWRRP